MKTKLKYRVLAAAVCAAMLLGLTACTGEMLNPSQPEAVVTSEKTQEQTQARPANAVTGKLKKAETPKADSEQTKQENPTEQAAGTEQPMPAGETQQTVSEDLARLQGCLEGFPDTVLAVAYLGNREQGDTTPLADWIRASVPELAERMPFLLEIPEDSDRVLGDGYGDLYCFVPKDDHTTLSVNHVKWESNGAGVWPVADEVLYRDEYAKPVLVYSNYEQFWDEPNVQVVACLDNGYNVEWCPYRNQDNNNSIDVPTVCTSGRYTGNYMAKLMLDLTDLGKGTELDNIENWDVYDFARWMDPDDFMDDSMSPVYDAALMDTQWQCGENWYMTLGQGNCDPEYSGIIELYERFPEDTEYQKMFSGVWRMEERYLSMQTASTSGMGTFSGRFLIMVSPSGMEMDIFQDQEIFSRPPFFENDQTVMTLTMMD